ncbi:MAG: sigma-70 family RNA polymerase sigma factor [Planctomycetes bacterium]|nr:sigma-70 family RNA polymerase sigma factor [Planctomycetota bacterium]
MSRSNTSDPSLVQACLDGSQQAWNELVDRYERLVYSVALKSRLSAADADDVFQTVFFSLHRNLPQLKDQARLSAWLITTTHRESWRVARLRTAINAMRTDRSVSAPAELIEAARTIFVHGLRRDALRQHCQPVGNGGRQHRPHPRPLPEEA